MITNSNVIHLGYLLQITTFYLPEVLWIAVTSNCILDKPLDPILIGHRKIDITNLIFKNYNFTFKKMQLYFAFYFIRYLSIFVKLLKKKIKNNFFLVRLPYQRVR